MGWDKFGDGITPVIQILNNNENIVCMVKRCSHINQEWEWEWRGEANIVGLNIDSKNSVLQTRLFGKSKSGATLVIRL